jgi:hypothetical protein
MIKSVKNTPVFMTPLSLVWLEAHFDRMEYNTEILYLICFYYEKNLISF